MFEPSAQKLIDIANESIEDANKKVKSKYTVIIAAAKRARQLVDEKDSRVDGGANALTVAVKEMKDKIVRIVKED